jgi:tight adherence protein C
VTWLLAVGLVLSGWVLVGAASRRADPRVLRVLAVDGEASPRRRPALGPRALAALGVVVGSSAAVVDLVTAVFAATVLGLAGYRLPGFLAARAAARRRLEVSRSVPDVIDVVAVSVAAGLSPRLALERATDAVPGPLGLELSAIRQDVVLGGSWSEGLREVARRLNGAELRRLAVVLERGQRLGAPMADRLRDLSREVRAERRSRREERARRAPVVMLFPLVFLILPAFVLAAVVPAVLVAVRDVS